MGVQRSRLRKKLVPLAAVAFGLVCGLGATAWYVDRRLNSLFIGPAHVFPLDPVPARLTDDVAVVHARRAMALDGHDLSAWEPVEAATSIDRGAAADKYLRRHPDDANSGNVTFWNLSGKEFNPKRYVHVELKGDRLECRVVRPK